MKRTDVVPPAEAKHDVCGVSSVDVQVAIRVQEALRYEVVGFGINLWVMQDRPIIDFRRTQTYNA